MTNPVSILREIHRLRRHAKNLQDEIDRLPLRLRALQAKVARQEEELREGQELLKRKRVETHEKEVSLKATQQQIAKYEKQRNEATTRKEYDALNAEIAAAKQHCAKIEDEILESMLAADEQAARLPALERELQRIKEEVAQFEKVARERQTELAVMLEQAQKELKEIEAGLPADIRAQYERLVGHRGEDAMAAVMNRTCSACYTEITAQSYNDLLMGQFVLCKSCGRILYLPEETGG
ncbi:MAG TPA: C4-type zinc ribbon domain-containing protein [Gemmataceae bacterium]|jgi:predicted  nucleic acid-binding Zn-ribbon protein|nr:C4-type zinc ribbon domain-containing protein [Gemmataceae bacterium]